jgi:hypothetical protein
LISNGSQSVLLKLNSSLVAGSSYWLFWKNVATCFGSLSGKDSALIGLPVNPQPGDWIISEILFDPKTGGVDYVEIFHNGKKMLDLKDLLFSTEDANGNPIDFATVSTGRLAVPGDYYVLTSNPTTVQNQYFCPNPKNLVSVSLPTLGLSDTRITLRTLSLTLLDSLQYSEKWHSPIVKDTKGVALERLNNNESSTNPQNWYSASSRVGYYRPEFPIEGPFARRNFVEYRPAHPQWRWRSGFIVFPNSEFLVGKYHFSSSFRYPRISLGQSLRTNFSWKFQRTSMGRDGTKRQHRSPRPLHHLGSTHEFGWKISGH